MKIKIFLASSITEFEADRMSFAIYLNKLNTIFSERYDVEIVPFICEAADHEVSQKERKQDDYNDVIADSDVVIFLVGKHLGIYTNEEFKFSCDKLKENYKPKIYVYFSNNNSVDKDVIDFKKTLETVYQHYYDSFEFIDTVKLSTLFNIRKIVFPSMKIEVKDDSFYIDGKKIEQDVLSPNKIQAFNNKEIKRLLQESCSASTDERMFIVKKINDIQNKILSVYMTVSDYAFKGIYNIRISEATRLLESGDIIGAEAALDIEHLNERREQRKKAEKRIRQEGTLADIAELQITIDILKLKNKYDDVSSKYKQAVEYALNDNIGLKILYDYAVWLNSIHQVDEALKIANQFNNTLANLTQEELRDNDISNRDLANLHVLLGVLYRRISKFQMAYSSYRKVLTYWQEYLNSNTTNIELWTIAEHIEDIACFILQVPDFLSDIVEPLNYSESVPVGQLATDIKRLKKILQEKKQIDFHDLEVNPVYQQGYQSSLNFVNEALSKEEKQFLIPDSVTFTYDNPIYESYILMLFALCIKESVLVKTKDFKLYNKGLAMTILNVATIQNILHDYVSAEDGANLAIKFLSDLVKLDATADVNEDMVQAYGVLYSSTLKSKRISKAQEYREKLLKYGEQTYQKHSIEFALAYSDMLFHIGMDYLHLSNYQDSINIFNKLLKVFKDIKENDDIDKTQFMVPYLLSNLRWIEAYLNYCHTIENFKPNFNYVNDHFNNAIILFNEINESEAFDDNCKANCVLEINWCNLLYLPPIEHHEACLDCIKNALQMCMILSGEDIATAYDKWAKTFEIITKISQFIYFCCDNEEEKINWLNEYYAVFDTPLNFIIENAILNPLCLIPPHFRHLSDYVFDQSPDKNFLENYETLLHLSYRFLMDLNYDVNNAKQLLIEKIHSAYSQILENANSFENRAFLKAILNKEKIQI